MSVILLISKNKLGNDVIRKGIELDNNVERASVEVIVSKSIYLLLMKKFSYFRKTIKKKISKPTKKKAFLLIAIIKKRARQTLSKLPQNKFFLKNQQQKKCKYSVSENKANELNKAENIQLELKKIRMACIMDEFNYHSFKYNCDLLYLKPDNWREIIDGFHPDLLFVDSTWHGLDGIWNRKISYVSSELIEIVDLCKDLNIPTVFWNKEDPVHFEAFINTACNFDYVFTTDIDCINRYKKILKHDNVFLLPFACQPYMHNPIEEFERKDRTCFAGAYYQRYDERKRDMYTITSVCSETKGIDIYDRYYGKSDVKFIFPDQYKKYIVGSLPYENINVAYKSYRYGINMNSIKYSKSMFARRVFELLASNTITISNYSEGLRLFFGDLVISSDDQDELKERIITVFKDELYYRKLRLAGLRKVLNEHTYANRLDYISQKVLNYRFKENIHSVTVIAFAKTELDFKILLDSFNKQSFDYKRLVLVSCNNELIDLNMQSDVKLISLEEAECTSIEKIAPDGYIAPMLAEDYYGDNYLLDLILATKYSNAQVIGKKAFFSYVGDYLTFINNSYQYKEVESLPVRNSMIKACIIRNENLLEWVLSTKEREIFARPCLSIDEFNYCREGANHDSEIFDDLYDLSSGVSMEKMHRLGEEITPN